MTRLGLLLATLAAALGAGRAGAASFVIEPGGKNRVQFESRAALETVTGKTAEVRGRVDLDPAGLEDSIVVSVDVDLTRLDTGIELRNKHMRDNHLHTGHHPKASFRGGAVSEASAPALAAGRKVTLKLSGSLDLHGVQKPVVLPVDLTLGPDGALHVAARFQVKLADFGIPRPQFLVMKLDEVQHIEVDLVARPSR
jgi:polyisoprenoid-binding protein YceI